MHNSDRQSTLRESRSRTHVLSKEIHTLKEEKGRQVSLTLKNEIILQNKNTVRSLHTVKNHTHTHKIVLTYPNDNLPMHS